MVENRHDAHAPVWGVSAEFDSAEDMLSALRGLRGRGLGRLDAYAPVPVPEAAALVRTRERPMDMLAIGAAILGAAFMFGLCTYATIWGYRFNIGGRPLFSWPAFIVPSVSFGMLLGAIVVYALMLTLNRLPRLNHPVFNIVDFHRATSDRYFVAVEATDDGFDVDRVEAALGELATRPLAIRYVPR